MLSMADSFIITPIITTRAPEKWAKKTKVRKGRGDNLSLTGR
jgi:hypothetical protein